MSERMELWERPAPGKCMIMGWRQWADAGNVSSGLPQYLVEQTGARRIGRMAADRYYLFQMPGGHHLMRPVVKLNEGLVERLQEKSNDLYYSGDDDQGFYIFLGDEPHLNVEEYAAAILDMVGELGIRRVTAVAGVYGAVPYEKDRDIGCVYSVPRMKEELDRLAVRYSNYEGGSTIGTFMADRAAKRDIEFVGYYALVPSYDFAKPALMVHAVAIGEDLKAWYDLMLRINYMFDLGLDLFDLQERSKDLISTWHDKMDELAKAMPQLEVEEYLDKVRSEFVERSFVPLGDVWEEGLRDIFGDEEGR